MVNGVHAVVGARTVGSIRKKQLHDVVGSVDAGREQWSSSLHCFSLNSRVLAQRFSMNRDFGISLVTEFSPQLQHLQWYCLKYAGMARANDIARISILRMVKNKGSSLPLEGCSPTFLPVKL